jgi:hypothetical protein
MSTPEKASREFTGAMCPISTRELRIKPIIAVKDRSEVTDLARDFDTSYVPLKFCTVFKAVKQNRHMIA